MYASPVHATPSRIALAHAVADGAAEGRKASASGRITIDAAIWLPVAIESGDTPVRWRFVKFGPMPYDSEASSASTIAHASPPAVNEGLPATSTATPANPIASPSTRCHGNRSRSHAKAMTAPKSGDVALRIAAKPAVSASIA